MSLITGIIGAFILNFIRFYYDFTHTKDYLYHLFNGILSLILSLALVLVKIRMSHYLILSPYIFLFYDGIFCIINSLIIVLIEYFVVINVKSKKEMFQEDENHHFFRNNYIGIFTIFSGQNKKFFIYFFLSFISSFIYYIIYAYSLYNYSLYLIIAVEALLPIDNDIFPYFFFGKEDAEIIKKLKRIAFQFIGYFLIFIAALILNEIIVFNFCDLNRNTFEKISLRGKLDSIYNDDNLSDGKIIDDNDCESEI